jgi:RNA polymerase sigma factor for flagellar operon FliA
VRKALQSMAPPVRVEVVAQRTGLSEDDVNECLAALRLTRVVSWDDIAEPTGKTVGGDSPGARIENDERRGLLIEAISTLPDTERLTVTLYYLEDLRLKEIGRVLNLSESRVSRLLKSAEQHIEEHIRAKEADAEAA